MRKVTGALAFAVGMIATSRAYALEESTRRPFYVQGTFASLAAWANFPPTTSGIYWHPDVEFGYHLSGRHDGFVLGVRQGFYLGHDSIGETLLRLGWDFAVPFRNGRFELTLAPFATFGVDYFFDYGVRAGAHASLGAEAKLFFYEGLYLLVRPFEVALGDFANPPFLFPQNVFFNFNAGAGLGFAF